MFDRTLVGDAYEVALVGWYIGKEDIISIALNLIPLFHVLKSDSPEGIVHF